ncbi:MAG: hypothetical protein ACYDCN_16785 [Bacteroidia bacterium]
MQNRFKATIEKPDLFNANAIYNGFTYLHTPVITDKEPTLIKEYYWVNTVIIILTLAF